ncbi:MULTISPECIES: hypothetical protein [unclassified Mesorhizobium]|nr:MULTISPECIES: hypothetical protein [unclassified Mesorhizobium]
MKEHARSALPFRAARLATENGHVTDAADLSIVKFTSATWGNLERH